MDSLFYLRRLVEADTEGYRLKELSKDKYEVQKPNGESYILQKQGSRFTCTCTGFKYRGKCKHLELVASKIPKRYPRKVIDDMMPELHEMFDSIGEWQIVGSYRRRKSDFKDIDLLIVADPAQFSKCLDVLRQDPDYEYVMAGPDIIRGKYHGYLFDLNRVSRDVYGPMLLYRTGSKEENLRMRGLAKSKGWKLNEKGLFDENGNRLDDNSEASIYAALGLQYKEPWQRN
jgi:DNA polymerase (family 10)